MNGSTDARSEIVIAGASKRFGGSTDGVLALDKVDITIGGGEFVAVVGPSGCGKSTLMRMVARLIQPSEGTITVFGDGSSAPPRDMGIVFQSPVLLAWRNVLSNVLFPAAMTGQDERPLIPAARRLLASVGLKDFETRYPHELSGGMRQRASIARALLLDPKLLMMDEPFGALDALTREQMRIDLEQLWLDNRMTVIFITHSIDEAVLLADRVVVMTPRPGKVDRVFEIDLPRPRGLGARRSSRFNDITGEITEIFLSRGVLSGAATQAHGAAA